MSARPASLSKAVIWLLLALPAALMLWRFSTGLADAEELLHPSGEVSARLMIAAMVVGPLIALFGQKPWLRWLLRRRRWLGVAAFGYALLHLVFYVWAMADIDDMLAEALAPGIWTGWAAFAVFLPLVLTSNDTAMRVLKAGWKRLQRLVYPAAVLTLLHWIWVHNNFGPALAHFIPLALLIVAGWLTRFKPAAKDSSHA
jgi:methionine sulfoxide reductase heme-binding subunit